MSKRLIIANWKMNPTTLIEAKKIFIKSKLLSAKLKKTSIIVCPPSVYLSAFRIKKSQKFSLGAQDIFWKLSGAHTGEISPLMIANLGASFCIVGHSERRILGETDEVVSKKLRSLFKEKITTILCVGERERDVQGHYLETLSAQIRGSLRSVERKNASKLIIAYEPIWAIGKTADDAINPRKLHEMVIFVRKVLAQIFGAETAKKIRILYGGSVEGKNAHELISNGHVSGFLVGHASLDMREFSEIIKAVEKS